MYDVLTLALQLILKLAIKREKTELMFFVTTGWWGLMKTEG